MNALGIWLGDITCRYFEMKNYDWISESSSKSAADKNSNANVVPSIKKRIFKFVNYFTPNYWVKHEWDLFSSTKRFYQVLWFFTLLNLTDLSHFFLKFVLWIPPTHDLLFYRIHIVAFLAIISAREYYEYITNPTCKKLGINIFLAHLILFVEWMIIIKNTNGIFKEPLPWYVTYFWTFLFLLISGITIHLVVKDFIKYFKKGIKDKKVDLTNPEIEIEYLNQNKESATNTNSDITTSN